MKSTYKLLARPNVRAETKHGGIITVLLLCFVASAHAGAGTAVEVRDGFATDTFGNGPKVQHPGTLTVKEGLMHFDLPLLPEGVEIQRAVLRFPLRSDWGGHAAAKLVPIGILQQPLSTYPPAHRSLDATDAARPLDRRDSMNENVLSRADIVSILLGYAIGGSIVGDYTVWIDSIMLSAVFCLLVPAFKRKFNGGS